MAKPLKSPKTFTDQIGILASRKLIIRDKTDAEEFFKHNNYYRVSAYFRPYYKVNNGVIQDEFKNWVTLEHVRNLYSFDSELRRMIVPILERVEVAFRTHLAYYFAHNKGSLAYLDSTNFYDAHSHNKLVTNINDVTKYPKDEFIKHYKKEYNDQYPIWVIIEALSFGNLSKFYSNMITADKTQLCNTFYKGTHHDQIKNWMECMVVLRNICAHHGRVFNRSMTKPNFRNRNFIIQPGYENRIYSMLLIMKTLIDDDKMWNHFVYELRYIMDKYGFTHHQAMGLPSGWEGSFVSKSAAMKKIELKLKMKKIYDKIENKIR